MNLALFINGLKSIAATSNGMLSVFDSSLIFQDPDLFASRFLFQIQDHFFINDFTQIENVILALTGLLDTENNKIKRSNILNELARTKIYDGFNINNALQAKIKKEKILILNDVFAITLGVSQQTNKPTLPCMVLSLDDGTGVGFINNSNSISAREWGGDFVASMNQNIWEALGRDSIYSLLFAQKVNVKSDYTQYVEHSINHLIKKYEQDNESVKSVVILGEKTQYIYEHQLKANLAHLHISVINDEAKRKNVILDGCFAYPAYIAKQKNKVTKIQYFSGQELIYDFKEFHKCRSHFISVKPLSNPDNYYKIFYTDGSATIIAMREVNDVSELDLYHF